MIASKKQFVLYLVGMIVPILYLITPTIIVAALLVVVTSFVLYIDISKHYNPKIKGLIDKFLNYFPHTGVKIELGRAKMLLSDVSLLMSGMLFVCLFFSKELAITSCIITNILGLFFALEAAHAKINFFDSAEYNRALLIVIIVSFVGIMASFFVGFASSFFVILVNSIVISSVDFFLKSYRMVMNFLIPVLYSTINFLLLL